MKKNKVDRKKRSGSIRAHAKAVPVGPEVMERLKGLRHRMGWPTREARDRTGILQYAALEVGHLVPAPETLGVLRRIETDLRMGLVVPDREELLRFDRNPGRRWHGHRQKKVKRRKVGSKPKGWEA